MLVDHMNKIRTISSLLVVIVCALYGAQLVHSAKEQVTTYTGDHFIIPHECRHIALLGCTPHPTQYLAEHGNNADCLRNISINNFLDIAYVADSFNETFKVCKKQGVDHLIIAYLPIYFMRMRAVLGNQFVTYCRMFFNSIVPEMKQLIKHAAQQTEYTGKITLIIPPDYQLARVPESIENKDDRIRYLIKQFPSFKNITSSALETIIIINNEQSSEDAMLISYLKYEYIFEKPINYITCSTGKKQFHSPNIKNLIQRNNHE